MTHTGGGKAIDIIKRGGARPTESFAEHKLHKSIVSACLSARVPAGQAETIATAVVRDVGTWLEAKATVTSHDIRRIAGKHLEVHHPSAAYLYQQHRVIL